MRVLWLSHLVPYPPTGGVLQRSFHLLRELATAADVDLLALRQQALCSGETALARARSALAEHCRRVEILPIDWEASRVRRAVLSWRVAFLNAPYDLERYRSAACRRWIAASASTAYDLVHVDTIGLAPLARLIAAPAILNHHNVESHMMERRSREERRRLARRFLRRQARSLRAYEAELGPQFSRHVVVSDLDGRRLREVAPEASVTVIPNGVDTRYFDRPANGVKADRTVVFVGDQSWYPNRSAAHFFLSDIWPRVTAREPSARCVWIGRNPCEQLRWAARADGRIQVLGWVDDLRDEVARASVFVCPMVEGGGTRLKMLDALALRKAIVSTRIGAEGLPLIHGRHVMLADEPGEFAERILDCFADPDLRVRLGEQGRALVTREFSWEVIGSLLRETYASIARERSHGRTAGHAVGVGMAGRSGLL